MIFFKKDTGKPNIFSSPSLSSSTRPKGVPLLPLRDIVIVPHMMTQLFVGRERSVKALDYASSLPEKEILFCCQKNARTNEPKTGDIFEIGTLGVIKQLVRMPDATVKVEVEGKRRARVSSYLEHADFFMVEVEILEGKMELSVESTALIRNVYSAFEDYVKLNRAVAPEVLSVLQSLTDPGELSDIILANLTTVKMSDRQTLLETLDSTDRLQKLHELLRSEIEILLVQKKIRSRVKRQMEKTQKEYYLNEQMQAIQKELGGGEKDEFKSELNDLEVLAKQKKLSSEAQEKVAKELKKLKLMHSTSAEATVVRHYLDWVLCLPWGEKTEGNYDLTYAEQVLDEDHFGLSKVKERILEHLAVQTLTKKLKGPILCFVGPPGVGKTSLAASIARATGRKYARVALGGVKDEAEVRGHRRTYIGAMPGKIIQSLKRVGSSNPVILLDEIDKLGSDFRGDPAAALLEVLDPEQNHSFGDHYLDLDFDLSDVMFITTANSLSHIPIPLQDRMEIILLSSYTEYEKLSIATKYLLPKQKKENGLEDVAYTVSDAAIRTVIHYYTMESGVRSLERELASITRKVARRVVAEGKDIQVDILAKAVPQYLGIPKYRMGKKEEKSQIGLTQGLSVSSVGSGDLLVCEVTVVHGSGKLQITGLLEKGMEESAQAAMSYVRSRAQSLNLNTDFYQTTDVHVHFPEFIRKDGPSAGVTMATSLVSALTKYPVRSDLAMTGEITLRGRVMPIGGVKEKLLAAHRGRISTVILPKENQKDLRDVPRRVVKEIRIVLVEHMDQVLREALVFPASETGYMFEFTKRPLQYVAGQLIAEMQADHLLERSGANVS